MEVHDETKLGAVCKIQAVLRIQRAKVDVADKAKGHADGEDSRIQLTAPATSPLLPQTNTIRKKKKPSPQEEGKLRQAERLAAVKEAQRRDKEASTVRKQQHLEEVAKAEAVTRKRAEKRIRLNKAEADRILVATTDRLLKAELDNHHVWEGKARSELCIQEGQAFRRIERSAKAHWDFTVVDAERIRRAEVAPAQHQPTTGGGEGMELLYNYLKEDRPSDEMANTVNEDRRRRVVALMEQKQHSEAMGQDLALRRQYTEDLLAEASRIQREQSSTLNEHLQASTINYNRTIEEDVKCSQETTAAGRQQRLDRVRRDVAYVLLHGNTPVRIQEAEENRRRTLQLKKESAYIRRGFIKSPPRVKQQSSRSFSFESPDPQQCQRHTKSSNEDDQRSQENIGEELHEGDLENCRPPTVPQEQERHLSVVQHPDDDDTSLEQRYNAQQQKSTDIQKQHLQRRMEAEKKQRMRRMQEEADGNNARRAAIEMQEQRQRERLEAEVRQDGVEYQKRQLKARIALDASRRRQLEAIETKRFNEALLERLEHVKAKPHPSRAENNAQQHDALVVKEQSKARKATLQEMEIQDRDEHLDAYLRRHTANASRQEELQMLREQRKEHGSRAWQVLYKAQNERQEVARLQQLMCVRDSAMMTKADSLMAKEVSVRSKATALLRKQQYVAEQKKKKNDACQVGVHKRRKLLQALYSHPPDMDGVKEARRSRSALDQHRSRKKVIDDSVVGYSDSTSATTSFLPTSRAATPQPVARVLPEEMLEAKPSLSNPTPALLRSLEAPEALKEKAWKLYTLLEESRETARTAFVDGMHGGGTHRSHKKTNEEIDALWVESTQQQVTSRPHKKRGNCSTPSPQLATHLHPPERESNDGVDDSFDETQPWEDLPGRVRSASDRLTCRSVAQDAVRMYRDRLVANTSLHDGMPKVLTPNPRLYEDPDRRRCREEQGIQRKALKSPRASTSLAGTTVSPTPPSGGTAATSTSTSRGGKEEDSAQEEVFVQRFYTNQVDRHQHKLNTSRTKHINATMANLNRGVRQIAEEEITDLVGRLTTVRKVRDRSRIRDTSKQMEYADSSLQSGRPFTPSHAGVGKKDDPVHPSPKRQRLDKVIIERLYVSATKKSQDEADRLSKEYILPLEMKAQRKVKKLTTAQMELSSDRLSRLSGEQ